MMFVKKRNNEMQEFDQNKITKRIGDMINKLPKLNIDVNEIANEVCNHIKNGITTSELDEYTSEVCAYRVTEHPDFDVLATRIIVSNNHKNSEKFANFSDMIKLMCDVNKLISPAFMRVVEENKCLLDKIVNQNHEKDYKNLTYFGFKTLEKSYLMKINKDGIIICERPQHLLMRVALDLNRYNIDHAITCYNYLSDFYFMHATPTLFNSGMRECQYLSCFLLGVDDSITSMYDKLIANCAQISKRAGGIGIHLSNIRAEGSIINSTLGKSNGILQYIKVLNELAKHVTQGGRRNGSIAIYLEPFHSDIGKFLELKKNIGSDNHRARDLFYALYIPDLFMKRLIRAIENPETKVMWSLMCPYECPRLTETYGNEFEELYCKYEREEKYREQVNILDLWKQIITAQLETSLPYIIYKDHINNKSNQKNVGIIKSSNLCVSGDTYILTDWGQIRISELVDQKVNVWNGKEFSEVIVRQTGENQKLVKVTFSNGVSLKCTPYHKFYVTTKNGTPRQIPANRLKQGHTLINYDLPIINNRTTIISPYTTGLYCGLYPNYSAEYPMLYINGSQSKLLKYIDYSTCIYNKKYNIYEIKMSDKICEFTVPLVGSVKTKIEWFEGYCDGNGNLNNGDLYICDNNEYLQDIKLMLQTLGVDSKIKKEKLVISNDQLNILVILGFKPKTFEINIDKKVKRMGVSVLSVEELEITEDTYCFHEKKRNMGMFNGILTGQCTEIVEYSDANEYACCTLASICLHKFVELTETPYFNFDKLRLITGIITRNLNNAINQNYYPCKETSISNFKHRPLSIGVQGLAETFIKMGYPYDSEKAQQLNREIFETIYYSALEMSHKITLEREEILSKLYNDGYELVLLSSQHHYLTYNYQKLTSSSTIYEIQENKKQKQNLKAITENINFILSEAGLKMEDNIINGLIHIHELQFLEIKRSNLYLGSYSSFKGSPLSNGLFQFDLWGVKPTRYNWDELKDKIIRNGVCNSLLTGLMPTATTAQITGSTEAFEPITSNIYGRSVMSGNFMVVNKYLQNDLMRLNLWNKTIKDKIIENRGSIENIDEIPETLKELYKTAWDIKRKTYIQMSADRGAFIDQSQSLNLFIPNPDYNQLTSCHVYSWKMGLKTGMYYLRRKPIVNAVQFTLQKQRNDEEREKEIEINKNKLDDLLNDKLIEGGVCYKGCTSCQ